jgi:GntR family transcriptional regulator, sialic acid-inducible nan operon repressor
MPGVEMPFKAVRRRKLHEEVAAQIEEAIITGSFAKGDKLPSERELMVRFGVGRPAVREALLLLERSGILQLSAGERARVAQPTVDGLVDQLSSAARHFLASPGGQTAFQEARRVFESAIARNAAEVAKKADIERLRLALEANRQALADIVEFERTDVDFHFAIAEIGGNQVFSSMHRAIVGWLSLQRRVSLRNPKAPASALKHHQKIFAAIEARDPEKAWHAMSNHLSEVEHWYRLGSKDAIK